MDITTSKNCNHVFEAQLLPNMCVCVREETPSTKIVSGKSNKWHKEELCPFNEVLQLPCALFPDLVSKFLHMVWEGFKKEPVPLADIIALILPKEQFLALGHDLKQEVPLNSSKHGMSMRGWGLAHK
jgi:hypothetical protein